MSDQLIPRKIIKRCKGVAIFRVVKAGFVWSGRAGSGVVIARLADGSWSAPSAIATGGVGFGGQIGAEITDFVVILNSSEAVLAFSHGGNVTLGGNLSVAAGPVGRNAEADLSLLNTAPIFSYSKTKGLFAGISVEGSVLIERKDTNEKYYKKKVGARELLTGQIPRPVEAEEIYEVLAKHEGTTFTTASTASTAPLPPPSPSPPIQPVEDDSKVCEEVVVKSDETVIVNSTETVTEAPTQTENVTAKLDESTHESNIGSTTITESKADVTEANSKVAIMEDNSVKKAAEAPIQQASVVENISKTSDSKKEDVYINKAEQEVKTTKVQQDEITDVATSQNENPVAVVAEPAKEVKESENNSAITSKKDEVATEGEISMPSESDIISPLLALAKQKTVVKQEVECKEESVSKIVAPTVEAPSSEKQADTTVQQSELQEMTAFTMIKDEQGPPESASSTYQNSTGLEKVVALFDFDGVQPGDLPFKRGQEITVTRRTASQNDWWNGECNGRKGSFPANYVKMIPPQ